MGKWCEEAEKAVGGGEDSAAKRDEVTEKRFRRGGPSAALGKK